MSKVYRMILGQDPFSTRPIGIEKTLKEAKAYATKLEYKYEVGNKAWANV